MAGLNAGASAVSLNSGASVLRTGASVAVGCGGAITLCELCSNCLAVFVAHGTPRYKHIGDLFVVGIIGRR